MVFRRPDSWSNRELGNVGVTLFCNIGLICAIIFYSSVILSFFIFASQVQILIQSPLLYAGVIQ